MMLHTNSLSLSLSLSLLLSQISNPTVRSSHHPSCCYTHNPNPRQKCESTQKKEEEKKPSQNPQNPTPQQPTVTHSLTHSLTPFTKMKFLCKFLFVRAVFFSKDTHNGQRKNTQENTIFFGRENIKKAGERKSFNKNPKKKKKKKKARSKKVSKSFPRPRRIK